MTRQWNSLIDTRNFPFIMLKSFALRLVTSNHMFQHTRFLGLKCNSTGYRVQLVCMARIVSNSYVIWEMRASSTTREFTTTRCVITHKGQFVRFLSTSGRKREIRHSHISCLLLLFFFMYQFPAPWRVEWQPIVCRLWSKDRFHRKGEMKTRFVVLRVQCDHDKVKWT